MTAAQKISSKVALRSVSSPLDSRQILRPPQFGLRTLLIVVSACGVLFAMYSWGVPPITIAALALLAVSVFCHVAGNCLGTRLRAVGDRHDSAASDQAESAKRPPRPQDFAPRTRLGERRSLGWTVVVASSVGVASGAIGGGLWTFAAGRGEVGLLNIAVGVIAFAVLGGIAAFAAVGFTQVLFGALWQAMQASPRGDAAGEHE